MFALFQFNNKGTVETVRAQVQSKQKDVIFHVTPEFFSFLTQEAVMPRVYLDPSRHSANSL